MLRTEIRELIALAERLAAVGERATLATLFCVTGSSYRSLGSMMVGGYGSAYLSGGVSGGCLEEYIAQQGRRLTEGSPAVLLNFSTDLENSDGEMPVPGCGGSLDILVERLTPAHVDFLRQFGVALEADTPATATCVVETTESSAVSVTRSWSADEAMACPSPHLALLHRQALAHERGLHGVLSPTRRALVHYLPPLTRLVIFGAGDDARPLCTLAHELGWHVTVADRRARLAKQSRFSQADRVIAADWRSLARDITFTPQTAVVVMTHSFADDVELLPLIADKPVAYFGILGPSQRRRQLLDEVDATSSLDPGFLNRLRGPIGLDLGERSAPAIAVAIVAEILTVLNDRSAAPLTSPAKHSSAGSSLDLVTAYA